MNAPTPINRAAAEQAEVLNHQIELDRATGVVLPDLGAVPDLNPLRMLALSADGGLEAAYETRTITLVVQHVIPVDDLFIPLVVDSLLEYCLDVHKGEAGNSGYERHVTKNGGRIDVVASVHSHPDAIAQEDISGNGGDALKERLLKLRQIAAYLEGGSKAGLIGNFAYPPEQRAKDIRELVDEQLAAIGVAKAPEEDEDGPETLQD